MAATPQWVDKVEVSMTLNESSTDPNRIHHILEQIVNLGSPKCFRLFMIVHELLHALGEQEYFSNYTKYISFLKFWRFPAHAFSPKPGWLYRNWFFKYSARSSSELWEIFTHECDNVWHRIWSFTSQISEEANELIDFILRLRFCNAFFTESLCNR